MIQQGILSKKLFVLLAVLAVFSVFAWFREPKALAALPAGLVFGFCLQKGFLCPASACSEVLLFRSWDKMVGLACCLVVSMLGYALLHSLGWVTLDPGPIFWLNRVLGGLLFGTGMVLAGGCISGALFKAGTGNLNALAALPAILLGTYLVRAGWLRPLDQTLQNQTLPVPPTLMEMTGLPYLGLAGLGGVLLVGIAVRRRVRLTGWSLRRSWKPWQSGLIIGLLAPLSCLGAANTGYYAPLGVTGGMQHSLYLLLGKTPLCLWPVLFCAALVAGAWFAGSLSGEARLLPKPPAQVAIAVLGGLLLGMGAAFANGCFFGHVVSGGALLRLDGLLFAAAAIPAAWVTTYLYLLGGRVRGEKRKG